MPSLGRSFWPSWQVVVGLLAVLAGAAAFWHFRSQLTPWQQIGGAVLVGLLGLGLLSRLSGRSLFGPILFYDLVRSARRGRHAFLRCAYLTALLCMLFLLYLNWFGHRGGGIDSLWTGQTLRFNELARFAEAFFETFIAVQFVVV
ncbi:MAG TPA: hypothetical protein VNK04_25385, partial [Gemmataceae bacterium]|nr:hypothetical protein [Gemmataceae bacterium]